MKPFALTLPFLISWLNGYLFLSFLFRRSARPAGLLAAVLSLGLGLGFSSLLTFTSFLILNAFHPGFIIALHILSTFILGLDFLSCKENLRWPHFSRREGIALLLLGLAMIPLGLQAKFYPFGGWDAWSVWNYKAKFLFLAGEEWQNLFAPFLWRSSPHYPLFLPLVNVWGWAFSDTPSALTPLLGSLLFTFLVAALLYAALEERANQPLNLCAPLLFLTLPFNATLATSQYCDIVVSFYLLASLFCLIKVLDEPCLGYAALAGIFLGFLSFTKPEGAVAALLSALFYGLFWLHGIRRSPGQQLKLFFHFLLSLGAASLSTIVFQALLSPGNQTFINGLSSAETPVSLYRAKIIPVFFFLEIASEKWNGLWFLIATGILLGGKKLWRRDILLIPLVVFGYLGLICFYYFLNTYFKIEWWLQVTLSRILFSLMPVLLFWIFWGINKVPQSPSSPGSQKE